MRKSKAIVLLSGGLDSTANYILSKKFFDKTQPVFFNYGQRAYINEKKAALASAKFFNDKLIEIDIRSVFANLSSSSDLLTSQTGIKGKTGKNKKLKTCDIKSESTVKSVWVPNRNGLLINAAATIAEAGDFSAIITGFNKEEAKFFPDNSEKFIKAINKSLEFSTQNKVKVHSFTAKMRKPQIAKIIIDSKFPINNIWSCYEGQKAQTRSKASKSATRVGATAVASSDKQVHCGQCESCLRFINAFAKNSIAGIETLATMDFVKIKI